MSRKPGQEIKFTGTWGNKIYANSFSTFRGQDVVYRVGAIHDVIQVREEGDINLGPHRITSIEFKRIRDVSASEILQDLGRRHALPDPRGSFFMIMKKHYGKRSWWDDVDSVIQKIYLEKVTLFA